MKSSLNKNMIQSVLVIAMTASALALLSSCSPTKQGLTRATVSTNTSGIVSTYGSSASCGQTSAIGTIFDQGSSYAQPQSLYTSNLSGTFEDRVKALLSATNNPSEVGQISSGPSDSTGVRVQMTIKLDSNGNVVSSQSSMIIKVYDSYVLMYPGTYKEYSVAIDSSTGGSASGSINKQTGVGYVLFKDRYGEIRFDGKRDAQYFSGTVSFKNYTSVQGSTNAQGYLGQFYVAACSVVQ